MKKCPLCEGTGIITRKGETDKNINKVKSIFALRKKGLTLREIGAMVGLSANTVLYYLRKN